MEELCRLCLSIENPIECKLTEESEILCRLGTCFNIQINLTNSFPNSLCEMCYKKIEEFNVFRENVLHNEHKLTDMLHENTLNDFYENVKEKIKVKVEKKILKIKKESTNNSDDDQSDKDENLPLIKKEQKKTIKTEKIKGKNIKVKIIRKKVIKKTITKKVNKNVKKRVMQLYKDEGENAHDPLKCLTCFNVFKSQRDLSKHYKNDHTLTREQINEQYKNNDLSNKYTVVINSNKMSYKCNTCAEAFDSTNEVIEHIKNHALERPYICKLCGVTYMTVYDIVHHGRIHGGYKRYCEFGCGYSSPHWSALRDHERRHNNEFKYKCKECGKGFMVRTWYEQHQNIHNNVRPFVCDVCGLAFHMHKYLMQHRNKHHPDLSAIGRYMCVHCSYTCATKMRLDTHMKVEHRKDTDDECDSHHLCDMCGKTFLRVEELTNHKRARHSIRPECELCNKTFSKKSNLKVHMLLIHNNEQKNKPQCNTCGKFFALKGSLNRHIRSQHPDLDENKSKIMKEIFHKVQ